MEMLHEIEEKILTALREGKSFNYNDSGYNVSVNSSDSGYSLKVEYDSTKDGNKIIRDAFDQYLDDLTKVDLYSKIVDSFAPGELKKIDQKFNSNDPATIQEGIKEFTTVANCFVKAALDENHKKYVALKKLIVK